MDSVIGWEARSRHVRAASTIGLVFGLLFAAFNLLTPGMMVLGLIEGVAVMLLVVPALILSRRPRQVGLTESLLLVSTSVAPTRELVAGVDASVRALQEMLDAFFDYSRLDTPAMEVRLTSFPVNQLLELLRTSFEATAAAKGLRLRIRPSPLWLRSDPVLLHRVLLNLVSNAVQHTRAAARQGQPVRPAGAAGGRRCVG